MSSMLMAIGQKTEADCTIAALAMYIGCTYDRVLKEAFKVAKHPDREGMYLSEMIRVAKRLGVKLKRTRYSKAATEGILSVVNRAKGWKRKGKLEEHVVVLWKDCIIDPVGPSIWRLAEYKRCAKSDFGAMLVLDR